jgi:hypothetical protein
MQRWQGKSSRFTGARLSTPQEIPSCQYMRDGLQLDGGGRVITLFLDRPQQLLMQTQIFELHSQSLSEYENSRLSAQARGSLNAARSTTNTVDARVGGGANASHAIRGRITPPRQEQENPSRSNARSRAATGCDSHTRNSRYR